MQNYSCEKCYYYTLSVKDFNKHLNTKKHIKNTINECEDSKNIDKSDTLQKPDKLLYLEDNCIEIQNENKSKIDVSTNNKSTTRECIYCKKIYANRHSLCVHLKKCKEKNNKDTNDRILREITDRLKNSESQKEIITSLFSKKDILETLNISPHEFIQINNTTNNTINNNQFDNRTINNLNLFFDTKCKDAMNISDFFNRLQVTNYDVENIGKNGFSTGIYEIIDKGLKECGLYKRPIHCTDIKRETLYIKENNKWQKDDPDNPTVRKYIKDIRIKSIDQSKNWKETHPNSEIIGSKEYEFWFYIMNNINNGGTNEIRNYNKVIQCISKITDISSMRRQGALIQ